MSGALIHDQWVLGWSEMLSFLQQAVGGFEFVFFENEYEIWNDFIHNNLCRLSFSMCYLLFLLHHKCHWYDHATPIEEATEITIQARRFRLSEESTSNWSQSWH